MIGTFVILAVVLFAAGVVAGVLMIIALAIHREEQTRSLSIGQRSPADVIAHRARAAIREFSRYPYGTPPGLTAPARSQLRAR